MRRFILKTIYAFFPLVIIVILMEILLRNIPNDYRFKREYLDKYASQIETLILGSSHSFYGLDPKYFKSNTFNASHVSQPLLYDFAILKRYEKDFDHLKFLIVPISYFTFHFDLKSHEEQWREKNYLLYYGFNNENLSLVEFIKYNSEVLTNRFDKNVIRILSFGLKGNGISCSDLGWGVNFNSTNAVDLSQTGQKNSQRHHRDINSIEIIHIFEKNKADLDSIIKWAKRKNVKVILLTTPAFETYRNNLKQDQLNLVLKTAEDFEKANNNCIYMNLLADTIFVENDFFDADHLNELGAEKLSRIVSNKVNLLLKNKMGYKKLHYLKND